MDESDEIEPSDESDESAEPDVNTRPQQDAEIGSRGSVDVGSSAGSTPGGGYASKCPV